MNQKIRKTALLMGACSLLGAYSPVMAAHAEASVQAVQQSKKITGTVSDAMGPVIGASVVVKGTSNGVATDFDGKFSLNVNPGQTLVVSYIGYITKEVKVDSKTSYSITLEEDKKMLDEVVVVGYGTMKKSDLAGASFTMDEKALKNANVTNIDQAFAGRVTGVSAVQTSGAPGSASSIRVRGQATINAGAEPLYVVDGVIFQSGGQSGADYGLGDKLGNGSVSTISPLSTINPSDIVSMEVLKDASATAIYGARGANGVVLVTTKKGKEGKVTLNYAGTVTFSTLHDVTKMMNATQWIDYARLAAYNQGLYGDKNQDFAPDYEGDVKLFGGQADSWANINQAWVDGTYHPELVGSYDWASHGKQTGVTHEHTISASGGTDKFKGYGSFGYLNQKGTQPGQSYQRFTLNTSFEARPVDPLTLGFTMNASYGTQNYGYNFSKSVTGPGDYYNALNSMIPWTVPYDSDGNYIRNPWAYNVNIINPIDELKYNTNKRTNFRINGSAYAQFDFGKVWKPLEGLQYRIQFGPELQYYRLGIANAADGINGDGRNVAQYNPSNKVAWTLDNLVYYNKTIAKNHRIGVTLLQSASKYHYENGNIKAYVASAEELWWNTSSLGNPQAYSTGLTETSLASYMARVNYTYADKYMLTASVRSDGASQLSAGHKWASFPSEDPNQKSHLHWRMCWYNR